MHKLVYTDGPNKGQECAIGTLLGHEPGDNPYKLTEFIPPAHAGSSGRIIVRHTQTGQVREFYPHVYDLKIVEVVEVVEEQGHLFRATIAEIEAEGSLTPMAVDRLTITVRPLTFPTVTLNTLRVGLLTYSRFHFNGGCARVYGPRGGISRMFEGWRANGGLKTWVTRPTEFRLPLKYGLKAYGELTHRNAQDFHFSSVCPCDLLPSDREGLVKLLKAFNIFGPGEHDFRIVPATREEGQ